MVEHLVLSAITLRSVQVCRVVMVALLGYLLCACAAPSPTPLNYSVRPSTLADRDALLDVAEAALLAAGWEIAERNPAAGRLVTVPIEGAPRADNRRLGVKVPSRIPTRRFVEIQVEEASGVQRVFCKVVVQEQVTQAARMFAEMRSDRESTSMTAIEKDAATTEEQNTVWRTIQRDQAEERELLEAILKIEK